MFDVRTLSDALKQRAFWALLAAQRGRLHQLSTGVVSGVSLFEVLMRTGRPSSALPGLRRQQVGGGRSKTRVLLRGRGERRRGRDQV